VGLLWTDVSDERVVSTFKVAASKSVRLQFVGTEGTNNAGGELGSVKVNPTVSE
jgi:hypothetical protein